MRKITKKSLSTNLRHTASGNIFIKDIKKLEMFKTIQPNEKTRYHYWSGTKRHMNIVSLLDLDLLSKFCNFVKNNDGRGGVDSDYIIITKKEYKNLQKRLAYFI